MIRTGDHSFTLLAKLPVPELKTKLDGVNIYENNNGQTYDSLPATFAHGYEELCIDPN